MLSFLVSIPIIAIAVWLMLRSVIRLGQTKSARWWWITLIMIVVGGGCVGLRLSECDVQISPTFIWGGLPLPLGFFHLEDGYWTDYVPDFSIQLCNKSADIVVPIILLLLPWMAARRRSSQLRNSISLIPKSLIPNP